LRAARFRAAHRFAALLQWFGRLFRTWAARRLVREMQAWPDHRLKDIGLTRSDIATAIEGMRRPFRWVPDHDAAKMDPSRFGL
jgi:uncharacterized protein YjiS (DUF1127 family)